jgi:hypothetical protein
MTTKQFTEIEIKIKILEDDKWLYRALLAIYAQQTAKEQLQGDTIEDNGVGFTGTDGKLLSRFAEDLKKYGNLLPQKKAVARGRMAKYAGQLHRLAYGQQKGGTK